jgi:two-component system, OmpR family, phosphate regulon response regulator OmpR
VTQSIAVVEDDPETLSLLQTLLTYEGYAVLAYPSGAAAQKALLREALDLIILDVHLERRGLGMRLLHDLRCTTATALLPIIVYSVDSKLLREQGGLFREQRCGTLEKPFRLDDLLGLIDTMLGQRERSVG